MKLQYSTETFRLLYKSLKEMLPDWELNAQEQGKDEPRLLPWRRGLERRAIKALARAEGKEVK